MRKKKILRSKMIENLVVIIMLVGTAQMAVDGGWSQWSEWSPCNVSCEEGHKIRSRSCTSPAPESGGKNCTGHQYEDKNCLLANCPVSPVKANGYAMISELLEKGYYWNECVIARYINTRAEDCYTKCLKHECACFSHSRTGICIISSCARKVGSTFHGYEEEEQFIYYNKL